MVLHTCLWNDVQAFNFSREDLQSLTDTLPDSKLNIHDNEASFLAVADSVEILLTWEFPVEWYAKCPNLKLLITPAAGTDWVKADPAGNVRVIHGTFHGDILAESLLSAILFMNHKMPVMIDNFRRQGWDRNLQGNCRLLRNQQVLIIGQGSIGNVCARLIRATGASVIGIRKNPGNEAGIFSPESLEQLLPQADHVVLLLPANQETDGYMSESRLKTCKPGAIIYNFGRGNALRSKDLIAAGEHLGGAFLDVTEEEPLPPDSPLWHLPNVMITPHSSCVYDDYRAAFITEAIEHLGNLDLQ